MRRRFGIGIIFRMIIIVIIMRAQTNKIHDVNDAGVVDIIFEKLLGGLFT